MTNRNQRGKDMIIKECKINLDFNILHGTKMWEKDIVIQDKIAYPTKKI